MLKRVLGVAAILGMLTLTAGARPAAAACPAFDECPQIDPCPILIQFDANCFAHETAYNTSTFISTAGSQMNVVGLITLFDGALAFLNANDPTKEYTLHFTGLTSQGTVVSTNGPTTLYNCTYDSATVATFTIYEGSPRNSPDTPAEWSGNPYGGALVPSSHDDGTLILSGTLCGFETHIQRTGITVSGGFSAGYTPSGGTLYPFIQGTTGHIVGTWCANTSGCHPANYSAHPNGKFDATYHTTPTLRSTWGRLKTIYR